jgi:hypothetical protein
MTNTTTAAHAANDHARFTVDDGEDTYGVHDWDAEAISDADLATIEALLPGARAVVGGAGASFEVRRCILAEDIVAAVRASASVATAEYVAFTMRISASDHRGIRDVRNGLYHAVKDGLLRAAQFAGVTAYSVPSPATDDEPLWSDSAGYRAKVDAAADVLVAPPAVAEGRKAR